MKLRRVWMCSAILALAGSPASAQNPSAGGGPGREGFAARRMQMLLKDITLAPEQQAKIDSIRARYRAQMPPFTRGTPPDSATRQRMRDLMRAQVNEIRTVLTADQQTVWDRNVAAMRQRGPSGP